MNFFKIITTVVTSLSLVSQDIVDTGIQLYNGLYTIDKMDLQIFTRPPFNNKPGKNKCNTDLFLNIYFVFIGYNFLCSMI